MPWLVATAYLHSVMIQQRRGMLEVWNVSLIVATFILTIFGTLYFTWASGLISSGDTSGQLDIYTDADIWNLVYVILSFRSETSTWGISSFIIISTFNCNSISVPHRLKPIMT